MKFDRQYTAEVLRVVDGDTFDLLIDLGFDVQTKQRIRLIDANTPETRGAEKKEGKAVALYVRALLEGQSFTIRTEKTKKGTDARGKYGRFLADLFLPDENEWLSQHLIRTGRAKLVHY